MMAQRVSSEDDLLRYLEHLRETSDSVKHLDALPATSATPTKPVVSAKRKELKKDIDRLKASIVAGSEEYDQLSVKYLQTKPRIVQLKRTFLDCICKLLHWSQFGTLSMWYDRSVGQELMTQMYSDFGRDHKMPSESQVASYLNQYTSKYALDKRKKPQSKGTKHPPVLVDELVGILQKLHLLQSPRVASTPFEQDREINQLVDQLWSETHRDPATIAAPHIDSFDYFVEHGLKALLSDLAYNFDMMISPVKVKSSRPEPPATGGGEDQPMDEDLEPPEAPAAAAENDPSSMDPNEVTHLIITLLPDTLKVHPPTISPCEARVGRKSYVSLVTCLADVCLRVGNSERVINVAEYLQDPPEASGKDQKARQSAIREHLRQFGVPYDQNTKKFIWKDERFPVVLGELPVMVFSKACRAHYPPLSPVVEDTQSMDVDGVQSNNGTLKKPGVHKYTREEWLIANNEDEMDLGGYFIINGYERVLRLIATIRTNYAMAMVTKKPSEEHLLPKYVLVRCATPSGLSVPNTVMSEKSGIVVLSFPRRTMWTLPVVYLLLAFKSISLRDLAEHLLPPYVANEADSAAGTDFASMVVRETIAVNIRAAQAVIQQHGGSMSSWDWCRVIGQAVMDRGSFSRSIVPLLLQHDMAAVGRWMLRQHVLPHLNDPSVLDLSDASNVDELDRKFHYLIHIVHKLFAYMDDRIAPDSRDLTSNQEVISPHCTLASVTSDGLLQMRQRFRALAQRNLPAVPMDFLSADLTLFTERVLHIMRELCVMNVFRGAHQIINTGNFNPSQFRNFYLLQNSGYSVNYERINMFRALSLLRSVHRGSHVQETRSSEARKLPLEAWGFLCPVETPDGAPCGVLNHLSAHAVVTLNPLNLNEIRDAIVSAMLPFGFRALGEESPVETRAKLPVVWDGEVLGYYDPPISTKGARDVVGSHFRKLRSLGGVLPETMEVVEIPAKWDAFSEAPALISGAPSALPFPGLYLFTTANRIMRPVLPLTATSIQPGQAVKPELIGTMEQPFLHIACSGHDLMSLPPGALDDFTYMEISPSRLLSIISSLTPFFQSNPSPRNLFQCQMSKQTMGMLPCNRNFRFDNKIYDLRTGQMPIVQTEAYEQNCFGERPITTNAVVAIIAYSEYDMDDAVVLNKWSLERGMFAGDVYKSFVVDATPESSQHNNKHGNDAAGAFRVDSHYRCFHRPLTGSDATGKARKAEKKPAASDEAFSELIHPSGLPKVGIELAMGRPYAWTAECHKMDSGTSSEQTYDYLQHKPLFWDHPERCWVDQVTPLASNEKNGDILKFVMRVRIIRDPVLGDKFSSRHGQKGTGSLFFSSADMPFSASGIVPDVLINPHAFPSRMTVGMMLEMLAGKLGSVQGRQIMSEASAWNALNTTKDVHEVLGEQLIRSGYDYYGEEVLYSGETGEELKARIYIGVCAYQRLRHMVMDKWQVRERVGRASILTQQPVKGRSKGGGIKVGEMERDVLLSHGCINLLRDRLYSTGLFPVTVCLKCGSFLTMDVRPAAGGVSSGKGGSGGTADEDMVCPTHKARCTQCGGSATRIVSVPFPFIYLCVELLAMNIEVCLQLKTPSNNSS